MKKVITYGTYDLLHYGHIRLLERAKALGDYLIVGVTADGFDLARGKINVQQPLMERIEAVKATGLADKIVVEEYDGQKIDDIKRYDVDIFTVGDDWVGNFDYINEFCEVIYLPRTAGVSSSEIRAEKNEKKLGIVGDSYLVSKIVRESQYVNGVKVVGVCSTYPRILEDALNDKIPLFTDYEEFLNQCDAVYVLTSPKNHYETIKRALDKKKHVICESPITTSLGQLAELSKIAKENGCVLMDGIKTAYSLAYNRMILLVKTGKIGEILSVDSVCTSQAELFKKTDLSRTWNTMCSWGPTALLPVYQLLGTNKKTQHITSLMSSEKDDFDLFTRITMVFDHAVASIKIGQGVKAEGELIISGTKGYIYVPAPWWKTDYFEIRFENQSENKRYFYQLDGEGIRYELVSFLKSIETGKNFSYVDDITSAAIVKTVEDFYSKKDFIEI